MAGDGAADVLDVVERVDERVGEVLDPPPLARLGADRAVHRGGQAGRQVGARARERRQDGADLAGGRRRARPAHRVLPRERLVEDEAERVEVRPWVHPSPLGLLGGHVGEGPHHVARAGDRVVVDQVGDAEVGELGRAAPGRRAVGDHDVLRLDVAVHDAALVGVGQRVGERQADPEHVAVRQRVLRLELGQAAAVDELGDQVARPGLLPRVVDRDDPRMVEARGGQRLARGAVVGLGGRVGGHHLHRDEPLEPLVVGLEDRAEAAAAQTAPEAVAPQDERVVVRGGGGGEVGERGHGRAPVWFGAPGRRPASRAGICRPPPNHPGDRAL
jgi:hypothetical protein